MLPRFLARDVDAHDSRLSLVAEEADHAIRVLRLKPGEAVRVFNGRGDEFEGLIESIERGRAIVAVGERAAPAAESRVAVTLAQVVLKHDLMDEVVRDAVMFGVAAIQPVLSARSEVSAAALSRGHKRERWERIAVSSTKQCGRAVVPRIGEPVTFEDAVNLVGTAGLPAPALMLVEPAVSSAHAAGPHLPPAHPFTHALAAPRQTTHALATQCGAPALVATLFVGPEGGWTAGEITHAATVCRLATFGGRTLRADAAGLVAMAALLALWDGF